MMRSLSSAVAGLRSHQTRMDVIGNNIANVNTYGFKSSRTTFSDVFYQTLSRGSGPTGLTGGTNPTQIGYGSSVATIDLLMTQSGMSSTGRALDVYINGDGMIPVRDANGNLFFTRLGVLGFDAAGNLVDSSGNFVQGFPMDLSTGRPVVNPDGSVDIGNLERIQVRPEDLDRMVGISIAPNGEIVGMLPGDPEISMSQARPPWLVNVSTPADTTLVGGIHVEVNLERSARTIPAPGQPASGTPWVRDIRAADGMFGPDGGPMSFNFTFDPITQRITATTPDGITYSGQYRRGASVELRRDAGQPEAGKLGFVVDTDFTNQPHPGSTIEGLGSITFANRPAIIVSGNDAGGNMLSDYEEFTREQFAEMAHWDENYDIPFMLSRPGSDHFENVTITINPYQDQRLREPNRARTLDFVAPAGADWLNGVSIIDRDSDRFEDGPNNPMSIVINRVGTNVTGLNTTHYSFQNVFNATAINSVLGAVTPPPFGPTRAVLVPVAGTPGQYTMRFIQPDPTSGDWPQQNADGTWPAGTTFIGPESNPFTPGGTGPALDSANVPIPASGNISFGTGATAVVVTNNPVRDASNVAAARASFTLNPTASVEVWDGTQMIGTADWTTGSRISVDIGGGSNAVININQSDLREALSTATRIPAAAADRLAVGSMQPEETSNWPFSGNVANVQSGITEAFTIGLMALARVPNVFAMEQMGTSYFNTTPNSGDPTFFRPGSGQTGTLRAGFLEMSNVDIANEFTDMIVTQRGFQANTRIITVSDEMLVELVNLRR